MPKPITRKAFAFELKSSSDDGTFTGVASVYGNKDLQGDIVDKGAFTKTLSERGADVPILWMHDQATPIGLGTLTDTPSGLKIAGKLSLGTAKGRDVYELMKDGVVTGLSIGYDTVKQKFAEGARHLQELKLYEVSAVTFPANEDALVAAVKSFDPQTVDLDALRVPDVMKAWVRGTLTKAASYQDRIQEAYEAVRAAFPLAYPYPVEVSDDQIIICVDGDYYAIAVTGWTADNEPTLGAVTPGDMVFQPSAPATISAGDDGKAFRAKALAAKAGARHSNADQTAIQAAHDHLVKAGATCAEPKSTTPGTSTKEAAPASAEPDETIAHSLSALNATMRRLSGVAP